MSTIRTKAVATAAAIALAFGGVSTATANQNDPQAVNEEPTKTEETPGDETPAVDTWADFQKVLKALSSEGGGSLSSKAGNASEKNEPATGTDLLGQHTDDSKNPAWARIWRELTYASIGAAVISSLIAIYNFGLFHGLLPDPFGHAFRK